MCWFRKMLVFGTCNYHVFSIYWLSTGVLVPSGRDNCHFIHSPPLSSLASPLHPLVWYHSDNGHMLSTSNLHCREQHRFICSCSQHSAIIPAFISVPLVKIHIFISITDKCDHFPTSTPVLSITLPISILLHFYFVYRHHMAPASHDPGWPVNHDLNWLGIFTSSSLPCLPFPPLFSGDNISPLSFHMTSHNSGHQYSLSSWMESHFHSIISPLASTFHIYCLATDKIYPAIDWLVG